jgi:hypothetical protein
MRLQAPVDPFDQRFRRKLLFLVHQLTLVVNSQQVLPLPKIALEPDALG